MTSPERNSSCIVERFSDIVNGPLCTLILLSTLVILLQTQFTVRTAVLNHEINKTPPANPSDPLLVQLDPKQDILQKSYEPDPRFRKPREAADQDALLDQDPQCDEFIHSVLSTPSTTAQDPSSSIMSDFFGVPQIERRSKEYRFQTPNYPDHFPPDLECMKIITAPSKEHKILLNFRGLFELEPGPHCMMDFLEVRDGAFGFSPLLGRFCGRRPPDVGRDILSTGPYMWVRFRSDSTITHRGFQAIYRFIQSAWRHPPDNVYRFRQRKDLKVGELWNLDDGLLRTGLRDLPSRLHHLPIEAAFDIRAPNGTFLMIHVINVTVPREFAWSCVPNDLLAENPRTRCLSDYPVVFGTKPVRKDYDESETSLDKLLIQDPTSIITGRKTVFEVYPHRSISPYAPPCPKIRRFCDRTVGLPNPEKSRDSERDFFIPYSRVVIRVVIVSPTQVPTQRERRAVESGRVSRQTEKTQLPQIPVFHFQTTVLRKADVNTESPCPESWVPCDAETCIPESFWCDKIINCPQWQDEGPHCDTSTRKSNDGVAKSSYELRKEQEKREADEEQLAAQKLHSSILGSLGLILLLITTTCIVMTVKRRKRERLRRISKSKDASGGGGGGATLRPRLGLNHVISSGNLPEDSMRPCPKEGLRKQPTTTTKHSAILTKSGSSNQRDRSIEKAAQGNHVTATVWNSTDSVTAPLLWQNSLDQLKTQPVSHIAGRWSQTVPNDLMASDTVRMIGHPDKTFTHKCTKEGDLTQLLTRSPDRSMIRGGPTGVTSVLQLGATTRSSRQTQSSGGTTMGTHGAIVSGCTPVQMVSQYQSPGQKRADLRLGSPNHNRTVEPLKTANHHSGTRWIATAPSTAPFHNTPLVDIQHKRTPIASHAVTNTSMDWKPESVDHATGGHVVSCRAIGRTQSWGGGLRLAGVGPFCNGEWRVTHMTENAEPSVGVEPLIRRDGTAELRGMKGMVDTTIKVYQVPADGGLEFTGRRSAGQPKSAYVSMPDMQDRTFPLSDAQVKRDTNHGPNNVNLASEVIVTRNCKPPSAKRPRMIHSTTHTKWIPTSYPTDTEDDLSSGTAIMDEHGSILSGAMMPEMQDSPERGYTTMSPKTYVIRPPGEGVFESEKKIRRTMQPHHNTDVGNYRPIQPVQLFASEALSYQSTLSSSPASSVREAAGSDTSQQCDTGSHNQTSTELETDSPLQSDPLPFTHTDKADDRRAQVSLTTSSLMERHLDLQVPKHAIWQEKGPVRRYPPRTDQQSSPYIYEYEA